MEIKKKLDDGIYLLHSNRFEDVRGVFLKIFEAKSQLANFNILQVNHVTNPTKNILRGLHYQLDPYAESKMFRVLKGEINLVAFDIRTRNVTSYQLKSQKEAILVARGYATGYEVLEDNTDLIYCSDNTYNPTFERGIRWNDPILHKPWLSSQPIVSNKDLNWPLWDTL